MRVLILEDDPFIAMDLQGILESDGHHVVGAVASVDAARSHLAGGLDYALLDVDVADGKSFAIAEELQNRRIPFAFVSASRQCDIPALLQQFDFIPKPYCEETILRSVGDCGRLVDRTLPAADPGKGPSVSSNQVRSQVSRGPRGTM